MTFLPLWFSASTRPTELRVVLGTNSLTSPSLEIEGVTTVILHKDFQRVNMDNDIALLMLEKPITFNELKQPICLPVQPGLSKWHNCWVAGWGQVKSGTSQLSISWVRHHWHLRMGQ